MWAVLPSICPYVKTFWLSPLGTGIPTGTWWVETIDAAPHPTVPSTPHIWVRQPPTSTETGWPSTCVYTGPGITLQVLTEGHQPSSILTLVWTSGDSALAGRLVKTDRILLAERRNDTWGVPSAHWGAQWLWNKVRDGSRKRFSHLKTTGRFLPHKGPAWSEWIPLVDHTAVPGRSRASTWKVRWWVFKSAILGTSLAVQRLRLHFQCRGLGFDPWLGN